MTFSDLHKLYAIVITQQEKNVLGIDRVQLQKQVSLTKTFH